MIFGQKKSFFGKMSERIADAILSRPGIDEEFMDELEEILITSDIGLDTTMKIVDNLRSDIKSMGLSGPDEVKDRIKTIIAELIDKGGSHKIADETPLIILIVGVNGSGKTTSIGKLAFRFIEEGKSVLLAAADTFRAAAGEQLSVWGDRAGVGVIKHKEGADPSAVIFDAIRSAKAKGTDVLICDTAGRLQTKKNLMNELAKMKKVIDREYPEAAMESLLVLDAATGKNAISQAKEFSEIADITGIVLTKLDGTAKGGIVITISEQFDIPVKFIGTGEKIEDLAVFSPAEFAGGIFDE